MLTDNEKAEAVRDYVRRTTGSETLYRHALNRNLLYTDGVRFLAETCGSWWLLDFVATMPGPWMCEPFNVWRITGDGARGVIVEAWTDTPGTEGSTLLLRKKISYSDFPRELMPFEWWVENRTMMLKEER